MQTELEDVRARFRAFAEEECRGYSPHYHALAHAVAGDGALVRWIAAMPDRQPNLFFAAVQFLTGPEAMPATAAELRRVVEARGPAVAALMRSRHTQTNEIGRCATLLPALPAGPLALVEVGASAGLCLLPDRLHYRYGAVAVGPEAAAVRLRCEVTGAPLPPPRLPEVVWRAGVDRAPVDLRDDADARWLLACVWADHAERRARLEAAIELWRGDPPPVRRGDLATDLPALLAGAPPEATLVVYHSAVLSYVDAEHRAAFVRVLARESARREVVWISNEGETVRPDIDAIAPAGSAAAWFRLARTSFRGGEHAGDHLLAFSHPHGAALHWL